MINNPSASDTLEDLRWKNRVVIFFSEYGSTLDSSFKEIEEKAKERKVVFFTIGPSESTSSNYSFDKEYLESLKEKFGAGSKSNWILIGLDGGVKLRKEGNPNWDYIFKTIDSMPMRQSEIRYGEVF